MTFRLQEIRVEPFSRGQTRSRLIAGWQSSSNSAKLSTVLPFQICPATNRSDTLQFLSSSEHLHLSSCRAPPARLMYHAEFGENVGAGNISKPIAEALARAKNFVRVARIINNNRALYFSASAPTCAHWASCALVPPDIPIAPTILPSITMGTPPSTGTAPSSPSVLNPSPPLAS
jgi:hypothetical protein